MLNRKAATGYVMVLTAALMFGTYGVWSRMLGGEFGVFYQGWVRSALVLAVLLPVAALTGAWRPIPPEQRRWVWTTAAFGAATQAPIYYAYNAMDIGTATLVFYAAFLVMTYLTGRMLFGERLTAVRIVSLILACVGLVLVFGISLGTFTVLALAMAALNGLASGGEVSVSKKATETVSTMQVTAYVWLAILVTHLPLSLLLGETQVAPALNRPWAGMLAFALAGLLAFGLIVEGFRHVDAAIGGLLSLLEVVAAVSFGLVLFGESLSPATIAGSVLILGAAMLPDLAALRDRHRAAAVGGVQ